MPKLKREDVIALVLILGCFVLIGMGKNHVVEYTLASIAAAYGIGRLTIPKIRKK